MISKITILSLFGGMACDQIALKELGIKVNKCYYSEIDKFAIQQTKLNFPNTILLGDVRTVETKSLDKIDIVFAGSPCTDLSFSGKMNGLICNSLDDYLELRKEYLKTKDENLYLVNGKFQQSILFWEFLRVLKEIQKVNPDVKFLLENVRMKKGQQRIINDDLGVSPVAINSNLVSAQNRYRLYWSNIRTKNVGLFGDTFTNIPQPEDMGIYLKDILQDESEVDEKYYLSSKMLKFLENYSIKRNQNIRINAEKSLCQTSNSMHSDLDSDYICVAMRGRGKENEQTLEPNNEGKTTCITSVGKDNLILKTGAARYGRTNEAKDIRKENLKKGKDYKLRRLTPIEVARLQTIPTWYKWECSDTQIYRMCGNGWTIEVIKHILSFWKK